MIIFNPVSLSASGSLLSKVLQERDDQLRRMREESTQAQKRFQQQREEDHAQQAEAREQLEHLCLRKEELKQQLVDKEVELEEAKRVHGQVLREKLTENTGLRIQRRYAISVLTGFTRTGFYSNLVLYIYIFFFFCTSEAIKKWQEKTDFLTQLESQVKRMKEKFEAKERLLLEERNKATDAQRYERISHFFIFFSLSLSHLKNTLARGFNRLCGVKFKTFVQVVCV